MSSTRRRHTIIAGKPFAGRLVGDLQKDWYSYGWVSGSEARHVVTRANHEFHVVSNDKNFPLVAAEMLVDAALSGKIFIIDLQKFSVAPNKRGLA